MPPTEREGASEEPIFSNPIDGSGNGDPYDENLLAKNFDLYIGSEDSCKQISIVHKSDLSESSAILDILRLSATVFPEDPCVGEYIPSLDLDMSQLSLYLDDQVLCYEGSAYILDSDETELPEGVSADSYCE